MFLKLITFYLIFRLRLKSWFYRFSKRNLDFTTKFRSSCLTSCPTNSPPKYYSTPSTPQTQHHGHLICHHLLAIATSWGPYMASHLLYIIDNKRLFLPKILSPPLFSSSLTIICLIKYFQTIAICTFNFVSSVLLANIFGGLIALTPAITLWLLLVQT